MSDPICYCCCKEYISVPSLMLSLFDFSSAGQVQCTQCSVGTYKDFTGAGSCSPCPAGKQCPTVNAGNLEKQTFEMSYCAFPTPCLWSLHACWYCAFALDRCVS